MATISVYELHPHVGSIWSRAKDLWASYVVHDTWTFSFIFNTYLVGATNNTDLEITIDDTTNVTTYFLVCADCLAGDAQPLKYIASRPGWYDMPSALPVTSGSTTTITDANNFLIGMRNGIWSNFSTAGIHHPGLFVQSLDLTSAKVGVWHLIVSNGRQAVADWMSVAVEDIAGTLTWYNGIPQTDASPQSAIVVSSSGGGGGSVDLTPIVGPLQDIALRDCSYSFNNGATIFNCRGKVNV